MRDPIDVVDGLVVVQLDAEVDIVLFKDPDPDPVALAAAVALEGTVDDGADEAEDLNVRVPNDSVKLGDADEDREEVAELLTVLLRHGDDEALADRIEELLDRADKVTEAEPVDEGLRAALRENDAVERTLRLEREEPLAVDDTVDENDRRALLESVVNAVGVAVRLNSALTVGATEEVGLKNVGVTVAEFSQFVSDSFAVSVTEGVRERDGLVVRESVADDVEKCDNAALRDADGDSVWLKLKCAEFDADESIVREDKELKLARDDLVVHEVALRDTVDEIVSEALADMVADSVVVGATKEPVAVMVDNRTDTVGDEREDILKGIALDSVGDELADPETLEVSLKRLLIVELALLRPLDVVEPESVTKLFVVVCVAVAKADSRFVLVALKDPRVESVVVALMESTREDPADRLCAALAVGDDDSRSSKVLVGEGTVD